MTSTPFVSISLGPTHANARLGTQEMGKLAVVSNRYNIYLKSHVSKISNQPQGNPLAIFKNGRRVQSDFELLQIRSFFSFTRIILPQILIESANLIHRNSIILFLRYKLEKYIPHELIYSTFRFQ